MYLNMINFHAVNISELRSEEVISFFWRTVYFIILPMFPKSEFTDLDTLVTWSVILMCLSRVTPNTWTESDADIEVCSSSRVSFTCWRLRKMCLWGNDHKLCFLLIIFSLFVTIQSWMSFIHSGSLFKFSSASCVYGFFSIMRQQTKP